MIWFFIAGWISGAVFMVLYAKWWMNRHVVAKFRLEDKDETGHTGSDVPGDQEARGVSEQTGDADQQDRMGSTSEQCMDDKG